MVIVAVKDAATNLPIITLVEKMTAGSEVEFAASPCDALRNIGNYSIMACSTPGSKRR